MDSRTSNQPDELVSLSYLCKRYDITRWAIGQWVQRGEFPQPLRLGRRLLRWKLKEVLAWEETRVGLEPDSDATPETLSKTG